MKQWAPRTWPLCSFFLVINYLENPMIQSARSLAWHSSYKNGRVTTLGVFKSCAFFFARKFTTFCFFFSFYFCFIFFSKEKVLETECSWLPYWWREWKGKICTSCILFLKTIVTYRYTCTFILTQTFVQSFCWEHRYCAIQKKILCTSNSWWPRSTLGISK